MDPSPALTFGPESVPLSVLDLAPVPDGGNVGDALRATIDLARPGPPPSRGIQARGVFGSSGTDRALITSSEVASAGVIAFSVQSVSTRNRFPGMTPRW